MVDSQHHGEDQGQQQAIGGKVAVADVATLKAIEGALAVEDAAAVGVRTGVEDVTPVGPSHRRGYAADQGGHDRQRVEEGQGSLRCIRHLESIGFGFGMMVRCGWDGNWVRSN